MNSISAMSADRNTLEKHAPSINAAMLEVMEPRLLLSSISGVIWNDLNVDNIKQSEEPALAGVAVYLDANLNGQFDTGEAVTQSSPAGQYIFDGLAPGTYRVGVVSPEGFGRSWTVERETLSPDLPAEYAATMKIVDLSSDGRFALFMDEDRGAMAIYDIAAGLTGRLIEGWPGSSYGFSAKLADNGTHALVTMAPYSFDAILTPTTVLLVDMQSGRMEWIHETSNYYESIFAGDLLADGEYVAYSTQDGIYGKRAGNGAPELLLPATGEESYTQLAFSPDALWLAAVKQTITSPNGEDGSAHIAYQLIVKELWQPYGQTFTIDICDSSSEFLETGCPVFSSNSEKIFIDYGGITVDYSPFREIKEINLATHSVESVAIPDAGKAYALSAIDAAGMRLYQTSRYSSNEPYYSLNGVCDLQTGLASEFNILDRDEVAYGRFIDILGVHGNQAVCQITTLPSPSRESTVEYMLVDLVSGLPDDGMTAEISDSGDADIVHVGLSNLYGSFEGHVVPKLNWDYDLGSSPYDMSGVVMFADNDFDGNLDGDEHYAVTDAEGWFSLSLPPGRHHIVPLIDSSLVRYFDGDQWERDFTIAPGRAIKGFVQPITAKVSSYPFVTNLENELIPKELIPYDSGTGFTVSLDMRDAGQPIESLLVDFTLATNTAAYDFTRFADADLTLSISVGGQWHEITPVAINHGVGRYVFDMDTLMASSGKIYMDEVPVYVSLPDFLQMSHLSIYQGTLISGSVIASSSAAAPMGESLAYGGGEVFIDLNTNGSLDPAEPTTTTNQAGQYFFTDLPEGEYTVRLALPDGATALNGASRIVTLNTPATPDSFVINFPNGKVAATVPDLGNDGRLHITNKLANEPDGGIITLLNYGGDYAFFTLELPMGFEVVDMDGSLVSTGDGEYRVNPFATGSFFIEALTPGQYQSQIDLSSTGLDGFTMNVPVDIDTWNFDCAIQAESLTLDWGVIAAHEASGTKSFAITNTGDGPIYLGTPRKIGQLYLRAADGGSLNAWILPGQTRSFEMTWYTSFLGTENRSFLIQVAKPVTKEYGQITLAAKYAMNAEITIALPGDASGDDEVGIEDFAVLKAHYGNDGSSWNQGDFNGDSAVDIRDFVILKKHYGRDADSLFQSWRLVDEYNRQVASALLAETVTPVAASPDQSNEIATSQPHMKDKAVYIASDSAAALLPPQLALPSATPVDALGESETLIWQGY